MNSTSVSTSCATERCTSSGSAFQRSGDAERAGAFELAPQVVELVDLGDREPAALGNDLLDLRRTVFRCGRRGHGFSHLLVTLPIVRECIRRPRSADAEPDGAFLRGVFDRGEVPADRGSRHEMIDRHHVAALLDALVLHESPDRISNGLEPVHRTSSGRNRYPLAANTAYRELPRCRGLTPEGRVTGV